MPRAGSYRNGATRWSGNGISPTMRIGGTGNACDDWRQRDLAMCVAAISRLQEVMSWPSTFRNPKKRKYISALRRFVQGVMQSVQMGGGASEGQRAAVERILVHEGIPVPIRPATPAPVANYEVDDGMPKPMKPPARLSLAGEE